jgi:hypothetical protein
VTAQLAPTPIFRATDGLGLPLFRGQLTTYQAGTLIPQTTYIDSSQTTPNANPIILNARGEAQIWLDPTKAYKFALTDQFGNNIPGWPVDNITISNANPSFSIIPTVDNLFTLGSPTFSFANLYLGPNHAPVLDTASGNIGYYARTAAEIAATVTPVDFSYQPGDVRRYGADATGGIDASAAIASAQASNSNVYFNQVGTYRISTNLTLNRGVTFSFAAGAALSVDTGKVVSIAGQINAASYQIFSGAGLIQNTGNNTLGPGRYNAKWWGAKADGVNNDTAPLQAAITAVDQGTLYIPAGLYKLTSTLTVTFPGTSIQGEGFYTELHAVGFALNTAIMIVDGTVTPHNNVSFKGLLFTCDNGNATGIFMQYVNKSLFSEIAFLGLKVGMVCSSHVFSNTFVEVGTAGGTTGLTFNIASDSYNNNVHINCYFGGLGCTMSCTAGGDCESNVWLGCDFEAISNVGLGAFYVVTGGGGFITGTSLIGCHFENNNCNAIYFNGASAANSILGISITGCTIGGGFADGPHASALAGIILQNCNGIHVHGNYIDDFGNYAIQDLGGNKNWDIGPTYATRCVTAFSNTQLTLINLAFSASIAVDPSLGTDFTITVPNATAFTITAPTIATAQPNQRIRFWIINASGGAMGAITWAASYKMSAWTNPANANNRSIEFKYNGTNWYQVDQTGVDIPN